MRRIDWKERVQEDLFGCKVWEGAKTADGYGKWGSGAAHRKVYEIEKGPIPEGYWIDHLCGNRACVNPDHLEAVTPRENILRSPYTQASINKAKTHCLRGHPFDNENTYITPNGGRQCRECQAACSRRSQQRSRTLTIGNRGRQTEA